MSTGSFNWMGTPIPFHDGESIAAALSAAGINCFGRDALGTDTRYFCGVGACQCCLVRVDGMAVEACLTPAKAGLQVDSVEVQHA
ncbi:MAG: 2Fe-2S iron-sulfur cluster-binding protein [Phyllobacterium sp.]